MPKVIYLFNRRFAYEYDIDNGRIIKRRKAKFIDEEPKLELKSNERLVYSPNSLFNNAFAAVINNKSQEQFNILRSFKNIYTNEKHFGFTQGDYTYPYTYPEYLNHKEVFKHKVCNQGTLGLFCGIGTGVPDTKRLICFDLETVQNE